MAYGVVIGITEDATQVGTDDIRDKRYNSVRVDLDGPLEDCGTISRGTYWVSQSTNSAVGLLDMWLLRRISYESL